MYLSETSFPHLVAAADARIAAELERRRVAEERRAETDGRPARTGRPMRRLRFGRTSAPAAGACAALCATA